MIKHLTSFPGQYTGEKILFSSRESIWSLLQRQFWIFAAIILISAFILGLTFYLNFLLIGIIVVVLVWLSYLFEVGIRYQKTAFIVTSRRVIKQERNGFFDVAIKELSLENIKQTVATKQSVFQMIFGHGDLTVHGTDNIVHLFFHGLPFHDEVSRYISRVIDYIKHHGRTDDIASFQPKKLRKKFGNPTHETVHKFIKKK